MFSRPNQSSSIMDNCRTSKYGFFEECFADTFRCITVAQWTNDGKNHYAPQQIDFCNLHFIIIIIMQNANSAFYNSTYRHLTTSPLLYSLKSMRLKISPTFGIICMQSSTEENSNISYSKGRKDNSRKIFFPVLKLFCTETKKEMP